MIFEDYEKACEELTERNNRLLAGFEASMQGLKQKTIDNHLFNVDWYINDFLIREDLKKPEEGYHMISEYLGYFFIRKCMWSTPASIKSTATSIKKFYKYLLEQGMIEKKAYQDLCMIIKENMEDWQSDCAQWNDPDADDPFAFDIWDYM